MTQGRLQLLYPTAPFVPLPLLRERELGSFVPIWPPDQAAVLTIPHLPPLTALPEQPVALPFVPLWPWPADPGARISPALSEILKVRRQAGILADEGRCA